MKLRHKVFLYAMLLLVICDGLSAGISFWVSRSLITNSIIESKRNELMAIDRRVRDTYRIATDKLNLLSEDPVLREWMAQVEADGSSYEQGHLRKQIQDLLKLKLYNMREFQNIHVVVNGWMIAEGNRLEFEYAKRLPGSIAYDSAVAAVRAEYPVQPLLDNQFVAANIDQMTSLVGVLDFRSIVHNGGTSLYIADQEGRRVYDQARRHDGNEIEVAYSSTYSGLTYVYLLDQRLLNQKFAGPLRNILVIAVLIFASFSVILWVLTKRLLKSIADFGGLLSKVGDRAFQDEIAAYVNSESAKPSMKTRLFQYYAICIIPLFLVILLSFFFFRNVVLTESKLTNYGTLGELRSNVEYRMNSYLMILQHLALDRQIQMELIRAARPVPDQPSAASIPALILNKGILGQNIQYIRFYDKDARLIYSSDNYQPEIDAALPWKETLEDPLTSYHWDVLDSRFMENHDLLLVGKIKYLPQPELLAPVFDRIGYVEMSVKQFFTDKFEGGGEKRSDTAIVIMDRGKNLLFSSQSEESGNDDLRRLTEGIDLVALGPSGVAEASSDNRMLLAQPILHTDWYIGYSLPLADVAEGSKRILLYNLYVVGILLAVALLLSQMMAKQIVKPIDKLKRHMNDVDGADAMELAVHPARNEFAALAHSFNRMLARLKRLSEQIKEKELEGLDLEKRKKEAQLNALHSQMNPHFLYNIFSSIHMLVKGNQNDKASEMIQATGKLLRFGLTRGDPIIRVEEELGHVEAYVRVQQIRYRNRVEVMCDWPREIGDYRMPKFLIQPLVENAFEHASSKDKLLVLSIRMSAHAEDHLRIEVADNGVGIEPDRLEALLERLKHPENMSSEHIGLVNVQERIQLSYGSRYGLSIRSQAGIGTTVTLTLPILKEMRP